MLEFLAGLAAGAMVMAAMWAWRQRQDAVRRLNEGGVADAAAQQVQALTLALESVKSQAEEQAQAAAASLLHAREELADLRTEMELQAQQADALRARLSQAQADADKAGRDIAELIKVEQTFERWHHSMDMLLAHNKGMHDKNGEFARIVRHMIIVTLNASIEAARAGEFGRGFAVVAEEMRSLAASAGKLSQDYGHSLHENDLITTSTFQDVQASGRLIMGALRNLELTNGRLHEAVVP